MESIEASGKSVDEAITQALTRLGKRREEVDIAVLQEPSRGAFGLGSKDARVRVTVRSGGASSSVPSAIITPELADAILGTGDIEVPLPEEEEELYQEEEEEEEEDEEASVVSMGSGGSSPRCLRSFVSISLASSGFSLRNCFAFSRPWPIRSSP